jgi:hypothetical protein
MKHLLILFFSIQTFFATAECKVPDFSGFRSNDYSIEAPVFDKNPKLGFSFKFKSNKADGTLFIYDSGFPIGEQSLVKELETGMVDIHKYWQLVDAEVRSTELYNIPESTYAHIQTIENAAYTVFAKDDVYWMEILAIGNIKGCYNKIRLSVGLDTHPSEGVMAFSLLANSINNTLLRSGYL